MLKNIEPAATGVGRQGWFWGQDSMNYKNNLTKMAQRLLNYLITQLQSPRTSERIRLMKFVRLSTILAILLLTGAMDYLLRAVPMLAVF